MQEWKRNNREERRDSHTGGDQREESVWGSLLSVCLPSSLLQLACVGYTQSLAALGNSHSAFTHRILFFQRKIQASSSSYHHSHLYLDQVWWSVMVSSCWFLSSRAWSSLCFVHEQRAGVFVFVNLSGWSAPLCGDAFYGLDSIVTGILCLIRVCLRLCPLWDCPTRWYWQSNRWGKYIMIYATFSSSRSALLLLIITLCFDPNP